MRFLLVYCHPVPESFCAALRDTVYPEDRTLSWRYVHDHRETMRLRLSQGGVRIAAYLNDLFAGAGR